MKSLSQNTCSYSDLQLGTPAAYDICRIGTTIIVAIPDAAIAANITSAVLSVFIILLDKEATSYNDIFEAFRLAMKFYRYVDNGE